MSAGVLLDTSFLITLVNAERPHHSIARSYYLHLLKSGVPMRLSSIAASEFAIKQPMTELALNSFRPLDFNLVYAHEAARLWNALGRRDTGDAQAVVRDDVKLIAQASREGIGYLLTEDVSTLQKYCERLRVSGHISTRAIVLANGFDSSALREDGQLDLLAGIKGEPPGS
jgi:hypothetical protein